MLTEIIQSISNRARIQSWGVGPEPTLLANVIFCFSEMTQDCYP